MQPDWQNCADVERSPDTVSGRWRLKGTRIPVDDVLANAEELTPEQIVAEVYEGLAVEPVRRVIAFARQGADADPA